MAPEVSLGVEPRTVVGRWLLAVATLQDSTTLTALGKQLNGGDPSGINPDEPAVVSSTCHLALLELQRLRGGNAPSELVDVMLRNTSASRRPPRENLVATVTATLREPVAEVSGLTLGQTFSAQSLLFPAASLSLRLDPDDIARLVRKGEDLAIKLSFRPPMAHR